MSIGIAGVGGVGSAAAYYLARSGIGRLRLVDQDIVETTNLSRIHGATSLDLFHPKAEVLSNRIAHLSKLSAAEPVVESITSRNVEHLFDGTDAVVDGLDNFRTRYILNRFAVLHQTPYMFISAVQNQAHLSLIAPPNTACLECIVPGVLDRPEDSCETLGVSSTITGIAGAIGATTLIQFLLGHPTRLSNHLLTVDLSGPEFLFSKTSKRVTCNSCSSQSERNSEPSPLITSLCGEHTANVLPTNDMDLQLSKVSGTFPREEILLNTDSVLVLRYGYHTVSLFRNGRLLIGDVRSESQASEIADEVWHLIGKK